MTLSVGAGRFGRPVLYVCICGSPASAQWMRVSYCIGSCSLELPTNDSGSASRHTGPSEARMRLPIVGDGCLRSLAPQRPYEPAGESLTFRRARSRQRRLARQHQSDWSTRHRIASRRERSSQPQSGSDGATQKSPNNKPQALSTIATAIHFSSASNKPASATVRYTQQERTPSHNSRGQLNATQHENNQTDDKAISRENT